MKKLILIFFTISMLSASSQENGLSVFLPTEDIDFSLKVIIVLWVIIGIWTIYLGTK